MKLLGKDITPSKVMAFVNERLQARGLSVQDDAGAIANGVEPRVDPLTFNLQALETNVDATHGLPLETHRDGLSGRAVVLAKRLFRKAGQIFINEALGRQTVFNGHVRDSYAQLSAEVIRLRQRVAELEQPQAAPLPSVPKPKVSAPKPPPAPPQPVVAKSAPKPTKASAPKKAPPAPPSAPRPPPRNSRRGK